MNYCQALDYLGSIQNLGSKLGLERVAKLLSALGSPQESYPIIHVAGTKGKGSTSLMVSEILKSAGYKVGLYTSPHLQSLRERVRVNGEIINTGDFSDLIAEIANVEESIRTEDIGQATFFEVTTALSYLYFKRQNVDAAVVEVGLGGRLDATNVIKKPACAVITAISYDHMGILGDTLDRIAREKAGILKTNCELVCASQQPNALETIEGLANVLEVKVHLQGRDFDYHDKGFCLQGQAMDFVSNIGNVEGLCVPLLGEHQLQNASLAIRVAQVLENQGFKISKEAINTGLRGAYWPCRLEMVGRNPRILLDGAHNGASADALAKAVNRHFNSKHIALVVGMLRDKDTTRFIRALAPLAKTIITTTPTSPRSLDNERLAMRFKRRFFEATPIDNPIDAVIEAIDRTPKDGLILATGSLYLVGELRTAIGKFSLAK